jgi:hypothetical protein
MLNFS